jgi:hypothetical protein
LFVPRHIPSGITIDAGIDNPRCALLLLVPRPTIP